VQNYCILNLGKYKSATGKILFLKREIIIGLSRKTGDKVMFMDERQ
jgi:hypothetical protein